MAHRRAWAVGAGPGRRAGAGTLGTGSGETGDIDIAEGERCKLGCCEDGKRPRPGGVLDGIADEGCAALPA